MLVVVFLVLLSARSALGHVPTKTATQSETNASAERLTVVQSVARESITIVTQKPNSFGETKSVVRNSNGAPFQTIVAQKPNYVGEIKAVVKNDGAQPVGKITTRQPNVFGETKSVITDAQGRKVGEAVAQKPNVFGEVRTVYRDANGKITGQAVTSKPNVFGEIKLYPYTEEELANKNRLIPFQWMYAVLNSSIGRTYVEKQMSFFFFTFGEEKCRQGRLKVDCQMRAKPAASGRLNKTF
jgi:hypothetical protein